MRNKRWRDGGGRRDEKKNQRGKMMKIETLQAGMQGQIRGTHKPPDKTQMTNRVRPGAGYGPFVK